MKNIDDILPLTPVQEGMLFHSLERAGSPVYVEQAILRFCGELDNSALLQSISSLVARHAALRSSVLWEGLEQAVQVVHSSVDGSVRELDAGSDPQSALAEYLRADRAQSFNLAKGPLARFALIRVNRAEWRLVISFHHIIADGWSMLLLMRELGQYYRAAVNSQVLQLPSPHSFSRYIDWLSDQSKQASEDFWRGYLKGFRSATRLSIAPPERDRDGGHSRLEQRIPLPSSLVQSLQDVARRNRVTVNTLVQLAWALVLSRYSGNSDVVFGTTLAGRPPELEGVEDTVGLFIQTAPTRIHLRESLSVADVLSQLHSDQLSLAEHAHSGLVSIQKWSEVPPGQRLFDSLLVFESMPVDGDIDFGQLRFEGFEFCELSNYPLALLVLPGCEWHLQMIADGVFCSATLVERLLANMVQALTALAHGQNETRVRDLDVLSATDRDLQAGWGQGAANTPPVSTWLELFAETAATHGTRPALRCGQQSWSYAELNSEVQRRANALIDAGVDTGDRVAIEARRDDDTILSLLAIIAARGVYVPLEAAQPLNRRAHIAQEAQLKWALPGIATDDLNLPVIDLKNRGAGQRLRELQLPGPEDSAYIIHTSGSTGTPRGVDISHGSLLHSTWARRIVYEEPPTAFLLLSSPAFDSSVAGIFWTLGMGGTLVLPDAERTDDLQHLLDCVMANSVSHLLCVPSLWQLMLREDEGHLKQLRTAIVAGEACPVALANSHEQALPNTHLYNEYGPTEATVWASVGRVQASARARTVAIGSPVPGVQLWVADEQGRLAPTGVAGELLIGGPTLAISYVNRERETALSFTTDLVCSGGLRVYRTGDKVRWLEEGTLEYIGRNDGQVTLQGRRIETAEIEAAIGRHPSVNEAAVVLAQSADVLPGDAAILQALETIDPELAEAMLAEVEQLSATETHRKTGQGYSISLELDAGLIKPPRDSQRRWLLGQLQREYSSEIEHLDQVAAGFVRGADSFLRGADDISDRDLQGDDIMEDWQQPILEAMADVVTASHGHVLEIGFGRGISATMIQERAVSTHTLIEVNKHCVKRYYEPWRQQYPDRDIRIIEDTWQNAMPTLNQFDGIFFHTAARNMEEFARATVDQITYAEHFFDTAAAHLSPGGVFTYLSNEIDSLGRAHQRRILQHFSRFSIRRIDNLKIPEDTRDAWWAPSMIVISAVK